jgi:putative oxidoreductase
MKKKVLFGVSLLFGLMMINSGVNKFLNYMTMPEMSEAAGALANAFVQSGWVFPLVALAEIVGGAMISTNRFRALGAIILLPVTIGIFLFHAVLDPGAIVMSIVLLAINSWVIIENTNKYLPMVAVAK